MKLKQLIAISTPACPRVARDRLSISEIKSLLLSCLMANNASSEIKRIEIQIAIDLSVSAAKILA